MVTSWSATALWAVGILLFAPLDGAFANPSSRHGASPSFRNLDSCPERCSVSGPSSGNWSAYPNFRQIKKCKQTVFYDFSLYDEVDDDSLQHHIHACSSYGPDFSTIPASETATLAAVEAVDVQLEVGWWNEGYGLAASGLRSIIKQMRQYIEHGHGTTDRPFIMFGRSGRASIGVYIGQGLLNQGFSESALSIFGDNLDNLNVTTPSLAMQLCGNGYDRAHVFGVMVTSNGTFSPIQEAIKTWSNATCLSFSDSQNFNGKATFTTPLIPAPGNSTTNSTVISRSRRLLNVRDECTTVQVDAGDLCQNLADKCGISVDDLLKVESNSADNFCNNLRAKQHVCCNEGDMPDYSPKQNNDGSCYSYQVKTADNCDNLAAEYSLTRNEIEDYNQNTWGWNGCDPLYAETIICLSEGTAPFPAPLANAVCGPQKPGSEAPTDGSDIADLNPCPLKACCNIWGQCGITNDFCIDTNTGAPGTAEKDTYGCISNCGTDIVKGSGTGAIKVAYFEGYGMGRDCLYQDASQIDTDAFTHIHFAFGTLTSDYEVEVGDGLSQYQFSQFQHIQGSKKILSFGGWDFSTSPATYSIFREGVTRANRLTMATNIANFIKENELDGVDIDWEYPGAPDLPDIPPASEDDGINYLAFLVILKNLLPGKTVSIAAPSSYWYLKQYPIDAIGKVVDYIVFMTYDLHGQWDASNSYSQEGCDSGNCLRSQVNLTETKQSLAMITKAGVAGEKVIVGVTSYGRSFNMAQAGCWGPECLYTGSRASSDATKGVCTGTAGYIADAEIAEIMEDSSRVVKSFVDSTSNSDILVYDDTQWVGYMSSSTKKTRAALYSAWGLGGTTDWASDLKEYHDVPSPATSWAIFKEKVVSGEDPLTDSTRNGNWTDFDCTNKYISNLLDYTPSQRWKGLDADAAWDDVVRIWMETDRHRDGIKFIESVSSTLRIGANPKCQKLLGSNCDEAEMCGTGQDGEYSGPAAQLIWNSLVTVHQLHKDYHDELFQVAAVVNNMLDDLENKFAPIPEEADNTWLLLLIDLVTVGTLSAAGPFFNNVLSKLPYFVTNEATFNNVKDTTMNLIGQSTTIAKDLLPTEQALWTPEKQDAFSNYMGQVINGWGNVTDFANGKIFDGTQESIDVLWSVISNGKLIDGKYGAEAPETDSESELRANIGKAFFGYSIPALWQVSGTHAFVIDSGYGCDEDKPLDEYLEDDTMDATGACVDGTLYYLVYPNGDSTTCECHYYDNTHCQRQCRNSKFSAPPGLDSLDGSIFGGITKEDLIKGSVRTWLQNGKTNGGGFADPTDGGTIDNLLAVDVTTPGYMRLPVCSPELAYQSWDKTEAGWSPNYPCDIPPGQDDCGESTFVDQTSDGSPDVADCLQIIKIIENDGTTDWTTDVGGMPQRQIGDAGSCKFGIEATEVNGNANYVVGGQDVIDIINEAVRRFGGSGKVGAKGDMSCNGNIKSQAVKWGLY